MLTPKAGEKRKVRYLKKMGQRTPPTHFPRTVMSGRLFFGITRVSFYKPGFRLPMRFRNIDMISTSQNFLP